MDGAVKVGEEGLLRLPAEQRARWGLEPGAGVVAWNGDVSPCVALMHSYTCYVLGKRKAVRRYSLGNILDENVLEIWNRQEYRSFRKRLLSFDFAPCVHCDCDLAEANEEDCFGSPFPTCGDCLWARGVILCP